MSEEQPRTYRVKPGVFNLIIHAHDGYGLFEHENGEKQWIMMSLMEEVQPDQSVATISSTDT